MDIFAPDKNVMVRVALFEDNKKYRESLSILIDGSPGFAIAGANTDANDILAKIVDRQQ